MNPASPSPDTKVARRITGRPVDPRSETDKQSASVAEVPVNRSALPVGQRLAGRYVLEEAIGTGGMATVYRAHDEMLEREVAVKVLHEYLTAHEEAAERFLREARMLAAVDSQHVVPLYDVGTHEGVTFLVMKFLAAPTLAKLLGERKRLPPAEAAAMCEQLLWGLESLHALGLTHRDVKPANIVVSDGHDVTLLDLGIVSDPSGSGTLTQGIVLGTAAYMSPEQALGDVVDARSDIYSTGITLFEMLTGMVPFSGETTTQVCMKHVHEPPPSPRATEPAVSDALARVVLRALEKRPERRFQTAAEMREALVGAMVGKLPAPPPADVSPGCALPSGAGMDRVRRSSPERRRAILGMIGAAVVVAAVALAPELYGNGDGLVAGPPVAAAREAVEEDPPDRIEVSDSRAVARARGLIELGDAAGAILLLEQAVDNAPDRADLHRDLGEAYALRGDRAAAIGAYVTYLQLAPKGVHVRTVRQELARLQAAGPLTAAEQQAALAGIDPGIACPTPP